MIDATVVDLLTNADTWLAMLRAAISGLDPTNDAAEPASEWITYLEVVTLNARVGASASGVCPPALPVEAALAVASGSLSEGHATP